MSDGSHNLDISQIKIDNGYNANAFGSLNQSNLNISKIMPQNDDVENYLNQSR